MIVVLPACSAPPLSSNGTASSLTVHADVPPAADPTLCPKGKAVVGVRQANGGYVSAELHRRVKTDQGNVVALPKIDVALMGDDLNNLAHQSFHLPA